MFDELFETFTDTTLYFLMGAIGTGLFAIRMLMMLVFGGGGGGDFDMDMDTGGMDAHGGEFHLFSMLSMMAFMMGAGWLGLAARTEWGLGPVPAALSASAFGFSLMLLTSFGMYQMRKLEEAGVYTVRNCIGCTGRVYLTIPERGAGEGQVEVTVDGRKMVLSARSTGNRIESFALVRVVDVEGDDRLVVEPQ